MNSWSSYFKHQQCHNTNIWWTSSTGITSKTWVPPLASAFWNWAMYLCMWKLCPADSRTLTTILCSYPDCAISSSHWLTQPYLCYSVIIIQLYLRVPPQTPHKICLVSVSFHHITYILGFLGVHSMDFGFGPKMSSRHKKPRSFTHLKTGVFF